MFDNRNLYGPGSALLLIALVVSISLQNASFFEEEETTIKKVSVRESPFADRPEFKNLLELQNAFVRNAKRVKPVVVSINSVEEQLENSSWHAPSLQDVPWYYRFMDWAKKKVARKKYALDHLGSGILLDSDGHILTNHHVVEDGERLLVKLMDGRNLYADLVGVDPKTDLAVIKISSFRSFPVGTFGDSKKVEVGEWVMAIGNPYGLEGTVTVGVVSGKSRYDVGITTYENFIQTDASINPGNSGGPLVNLDGEIIGINTAVAELGSGVGFAIPIKMALEVSRQLIDHGNVERGWLGVGIQSLTPELAQSFDLPQGASGVLVNSVQEKTPAESGGILRGDIIFQFDGGKVPNSKMFQQMVADTEIGKKVEVTIFRNGEEKRLWIKIGKLFS
ncbi:MAG: PDZ domain-containing protein [Candidatus Nitrohelix vancouverensis]|uniref:PDZ domain-containing protein n=1 Tax=Candidatus Nitrohelix vancouverensis TaxID=2705534 RepID=A0A7T0G3Z7_9BACT|nr:MAG: PDZ domain-containing protein [Candidatus Nitrohelix vancouverensis]